jgi:arylsulfatase A-like enzyme
MSMLSCSKQGDKRPNILFIIADDWGPDQASILGDDFIGTATFDKVAKEGVLFTNAFVATPSCTASRAAILTGQMPHRLGEAFNLSCNWTHIPPLYTDLLREAGYHVGYTRKGWGPGIHEGRELNPAGEKYQDFEQFLSKRPGGKPFCFWFGSHDPHRPYDAGLAAEFRFDPGKAKVPPYLPDVSDVRRDLADYYAEIKRFDIEAGQLLDALEQTGESANTIVVMTGDNGLSFPRAKAHLYDAGTKVPLAIRWPARARGGRAVADFVSFTDFASTFLEAAGVRIPASITGRSLMPILVSYKSGRVDPKRDKVFTERERHTWCHPEGKSYPVRALRTKHYLYIRNFRPDLFPAGHPFLRREKGAPKGYGDCEDGPSKYFLIDHKDDPRYAPYYRQCFSRRPAEELYDLRNDPAQLINVVSEPAYGPVLSAMRAELSEWMIRTKDPRAKGETDIWDAGCWYQQPKADIRMPGYEKADSAK